MPERSITQAGLSRPFFSCGRRSVPPASSFESAGAWARTFTHSSRLPGSTSSNRRTRDLLWLVYLSTSFQEEETRMRIGFIGLDNMGGPMALNVLKAGHAMVVNDVRHELAKPHLAQGARWADTPKAVAQASEVVFTSLPGPREVEAVVLGANGILEGAVRGTLYVDLSTNSATLIRKIHGICAERGVDVLDAPVSGGVPGALSKSSFGQGRVLKDMIPNTVFPGAFDDVNFALRLLRKDVGLATELGREYHVPMMIAALAEQQLEEALGRGWGDKDSMTFFRLQEERAGVELRTKNRGTTS